jgi:hypothetical protein
MAQEHNEQFRYWFYSPNCKTRTYREDIIDNIIMEKNVNTKREYHLILKASFVRPFYYISTIL